MKKIFKIILFVLCLTGCNVRENQLLRKQEHAERLTKQLYEAIEVNQIDKVWEICHEDDDIIYLVFNEGKLVFWSDNTITTASLPPYETVGWHSFRFTNAECHIRWTRHKDSSILTIIPQKWHYPDKELLQQSFSYQPLNPNQDKSQWSVQRTRKRVYLIILTIIGLLTLCHAIWVIVVNKGFGNVKLRFKIQVIMSVASILIFAIIIFSTARYARKRYIESQEERLQTKCYHVQAALRSMYFWDFALTQGKTIGLNIDLRDLAHNYETDIHVFDLYGQLIGSSTPFLFEHGLLSQHMAPEVFFSENKRQIIYEEREGVKCMNSYMEFYNGANLQIGYIAMPTFISEEELAREQDAYMAQLLPPSIVMLVLILILSFLAARALTIPIRTLIDNMQHFKVGQKGNHIVYAYHDEIGQLVEHYNELVDRVEHYTRRLARSEREGAWRTMARQIAHEINNPLTPMKLTIQQLQRVYGTEGFGEKWEKSSNMLIEQIDQLSRIVASFSTFAKMPEVHISEVDVAEKLTDTIALHSNNPYQIPIRYVGPDHGVTALTDGEQLPQVFTNIIRNAVQALNQQEDGDIIIRLQETKDEVCISFSDNGPGIPEEIRDKIFLPNFTTKSSGNGLGLAISKNIIESSNGRITLECHENETIFRIYLKKEE